AVFGKISASVPAVTKRDLVNPPGRCVRHLIVMTLPGIAPIAHIDRSIGPVVDRNTAKPWIICKQEILAVLGNIRGTLPFQEIVVHTAAVKVTREQGVSESVGKTIAQIDHAPHVCVSAAGV